MAVRHPLPPGHLRQSRPGGGHGRPATRPAYPGRTRAPLPPLRTTNLRADDTFVQDPGWYAAAKRYQNFASEAAQSRTLLLELGVGMNTPAIIKYPFWRMTYHNPRAHYATVSLDAVAPKQISERSTVVQADIASVLRLLAGA